MLRLALHLLLIVGLLLDAVAPAAAHAHGSRAAGEHAEASARPHAGPGHAAADPGMGAHGDHHAHHAMHAGAQSPERDLADAAAPASASHDACGGAGCACGCVLPPALTLPALATATMLRAAASIVHTPVPALAAPTAPPFRPPAAVHPLIA